jgi:hypothetical protein
VDAFLQPAGADAPRYAVLAHRVHGSGAIYWVGVDELWRMRHEVGDQRYFKFYGRVIRALAESRLSSRSFGPSLRALRPRVRPGAPAELRVAVDPLRPTVEMSATIRHLGTGEEWTVPLSPVDDPSELGAEWTPPSTGTYEVRTRTEPSSTARFEVHEQSAPRVADSPPDVAPPTADEDQSPTRAGVEAEEPMSQALVWLLVALAAGTVAAVYVLRRRAA